MATPKRRSPAWLFFVFAFIVAVAGTFVLLPELIPQNIRALMPALLLGSTSTAVPADSPLTSVTATENLASAVIHRLPIFPTSISHGHRRLRFPAGKSVYLEAVPPPSDGLDQMAFASPIALAFRIYTDLRGILPSCYELPDGAL
jgi:hypothetical protein